MIGTYLSWFSYICFTCFLFLFPFEEFIIESFMFSSETNVSHKWLYDLIWSNLSYPLIRFRHATDRCLLRVHFYQSVRKIWHILFLFQNEIRNGRADVPIRIRSRVVQIWVKRPDRKPVVRVAANQRSLAINPFSFLPFYFFCKLFDLLIIFHEYFCCLLYNAIWKSGFYNFTSYHIRKFSRDLKFFFWFHFISFEIH